MRRHKQRWGGIIPGKKAAWDAVLAELAAVLLLANSAMISTMPEISMHIIINPKKVIAATAAGLLFRVSRSFSGAISKLLEINIPARTVTIDGERVELTPKEYDLLFYLVENKNIALSRDKLLSDIWGYDFFGDDRTIDTHIKNLRSSLGKYRDYIVTLRGVGYKFEVKD